MSAHARQAYRYAAIDKDKRRDARINVEPSGRHARPRSCQSGAQRVRNAGPVPRELSPAAVRAVSTTRGYVRARHAIFALPARLRTSANSCPSGGSASQRTTTCTPTMGWMQMSRCATRGLVAGKYTGTSAAVVCDRIRASPTSSTASAAGRACHQAPVAAQTRPSTRTQPKSRPTAAQ